MVQYNTIIKVIEDYLVKCPTIAEMQRMLKSMSADEKLEQLSSQGLLNQGELEYYKYLQKLLGLINNQDKEILERREQGKPFYSDEELLALDKERLKELNPKLFQFERRIIEGYKKETSSFDINLDDYSEDEMTKWDSFKEWSKQLGDNERLNSENQKDIGLTEDDKTALRDYFGNGAETINSYLNNGETWNKYSDSERKRLTPKLNKMEKQISGAIKKSKGLESDTVVYRGGLFDVTKVTGDSIKFKGYMSCTFQKHISKNFIENFHQNKPSELKYVYKILLPKGTKGLCANDLSEKEGLTNCHSEHEFLMDKGLEFDIVDIDYGSHMVTLIPKGA